MRRREFFDLAAGFAVAGMKPLWPQFVERAGAPHAGKVLAAIQPHSDDIALLCAGTVAKLMVEGYTGYMIRATNDDMGDDVGEPGTVGENVLRNEREAAEQARVLGLKRDFALNYSNHRMSDISRNELICRLIFLFRFFQVDTVFCYDPWAHDEENPDHYVLGHCVEAACWMAGRVHDYPEQIAAGFPAHAVTDKYYYARHPDITGPGSERNWQSRARSFRCWGMTTGRPAGITSGSSCWLATGCSASGMEWNTRRGSTTLVRRRRRSAGRNPAWTALCGKTRCR